MVGVLFITIFPFYWVAAHRAVEQLRAATRTRPRSLPTGFTGARSSVSSGISSQAQALARAAPAPRWTSPLYLRNSVIYASVLTACVVFCSALAAYAFARLHWRGRNLVFSIFLCALMIPGILTLLPNFVFIKDLGLSTASPA